MRQFNYKCVVAKNGTKMYYKRVNSKWKRISNKVGQKAEKGKRKYMGNGNDNDNKTDSDKYYDNIKKHTNQTTFANQPYYQNLNINVKSQHKHKKAGSLNLPTDEEIFLKQKQQKQQKQQQQIDQKYQDEMKNLRRKQKNDRKNWEEEERKQQEQIRLRQEQIKNKKDWAIDLGNYASRTTVSDIKKQDEVRNNRRKAGFRNWDV